MSTDNLAGYSVTLLDGPHKGTHELDALLADKGLPCFLTKNRLHFATTRQREDVYTLQGETFVHTGTFEGYADHWPWVCGRAERAETQA